MFVDKFVVDDIVITGGEIMSSNILKMLSPEEVDRIKEVFGQNAKGGIEKKAFEPPVQGFPFSPEAVFVSKITELERKNAALEQKVEELKAELEMYKRPLTEVLEEAAKGLGKELRRENELPHQ